MRQSLLYFIAAAVFAVATGLNLFNDGFNLKTVLGAAFVVVMLALGIKLRRTERG